MPINTDPKFVQSLLKQISELTMQISELTAQLSDATVQINALQDQVKNLLQTIAELQEQKNKNSQNSSKPPSSDGYAKKPQPKSLRPSDTGRKKGGQKGHKGANLMQRKPDEVVSCMPSDCQGCPHYEECRKTAKVKESRQVVDAEVKVKVTQYDRCLVKCCPMSGWRKAGKFPEGVNGPVQYGDNLNALVVALNTVGAVSISRTHEILANVFDIPLSEGCISSMVSKCASKVQGALDVIKNLALGCDVNNADESGIRAEKKLFWAHVFCNGAYTLLKLHEKRGWKAMEAIGILAGCHGTLVHDCLSSYWQHPGTLLHAICNAHLLRELTGVEENHPTLTWAKKFKQLLLDMKAERDKQTDAGSTALSQAQQDEYSKRYDEIIDLAYKETPLPIQPPRKRKGGRKKRGKVLALVDRLKKYKASVCLFIKNFDVPFDNNQAERDLRMVKAKIKKGRRTGIP